MSTSELAPPLVFRSDVKLFKAATYREVVAAAEEGTSVWFLFWGLPQRDGTIGYQGEHRTRVQLIPRIVSTLRGSTLSITGELDGRVLVGEHVWIWCQWHGEAVKGTIMFLDRTS
ncbi:hypothetical protein HJC99_01360 [Candidatus Saccharibacteria bacterium]|nr:hypothetical protein [Candidatus Saccharibacteria bacterium]